MYLVVHVPQLKRMTDPNVEAKATICVLVLTCLACRAAAGVSDICWHSESALLWYEWVSAEPDTSPGPPWCSGSLKADKSKHELQLVASVENKWHAVASSNAYDTVWKKGLLTLEPTFGRWLDEGFMAHRINVHACVPVRHGKCCALHFNFADYFSSFLITSYHGWQASITSHDLRASLCHHARPVPTFSEYLFQNTHVANVSNFRSRVGFGTVWMTSKRMTSSEESEMMKAANLMK